MSNVMGSPVGRILEQPLKHLRNVLLLLFSKSLLWRIPFLTNNTIPSCSPQDNLKCYVSEKEVMDLEA